MKKIKRLIRNARDALTYVRTFSQPQANVIYNARQIDDADAHSLRVAKQLHASVYLSVGFVDEDDIKDDIIHHKADPHQNHSVYFVAERKGIVVGVARAITYKGEGEHHESFPILSNALIYVRSKERIEKMHPITIVEISALTKKRGESSIVPLLLYRELWRYSIKHNHKVWVMACDVRLYERLKLLFGPALTRIGKRTPYKGGDVIPIALQLDDSVKYLQKTVQNPGRDVLRLRWYAARFMLNKVEY